MTTSNKQRNSITTACFLALISGTLVSGCSEIDSPIIGSIELSGTFSTAQEKLIEEINPDQFDRFE